MGYDDARGLPKTMNGDVVVNSSRQPVWIWRDYATQALAGKPAGTFAAPKNIVFKKIDLMTGVPSAQGTRVAFVRGTEPGARGQQVASYLNITIPIDTRTDTRATAETPQDYIEWREISPSDVQRYAQPLPLAQNASQVFTGGQELPVNGASQPSPSGSGTQPPADEGQTGNEEEDVGWLDWGN